MAERVLMKGNEALAEAAIKAGCRHFFGYPITPQTEVSAYMSKRMPKIGGTFLQAESEIGAINMVLGAAGAGVRALTSSSSPGISLKTEGISYMAGSDLPAVIVSVQRGGPGLGSIQPAQSDYWQTTKALGHGDFFVLVYAPSTVQEMVDLMFLAYDKADEYRIPAVMLMDGVLGQMMEPVVFPDEDKTDLPEKEWAATGHQNKREHNVINSLYLEPDKLEKTVIDRFKKYDVIKAKEAMVEEYLVEDAEYIMVAYGATARIVKGAVNAARAKGIKVGMIRPITLWPFPVDAINKACEHTKEFKVVEMSMGQMVEDVELYVKGRAEVSFFGRTGGVIPTVSEVEAEIEKMAGGAK